MTALLCPRNCAQEAATNTSRPWWNRRRKRSRPSPRRTVRGNRVGALARYVRARNRRRCASRHARRRWAAWREPRDLGGPCDGAWDAGHAGFDVAEVFAIGELSESEANRMIPGGEVFDAAMALIPLGADLQLVTGNDLHVMRGNQSALTHRVPPGWAGRKFDGAGKGPKNWNQNISS